MPKYKALIIGCGNMGVLNDAPESGNEHKTISYAKALRDNGNFEVFYYDKDYTKVKKAIELWGGNYDSEDYYDVVIIATPDNTHWVELTNIIKYQDKIPKLVICEKPLCETVEEAKDIIRRYEATGIPILLDYTRRFIPEIRELMLNKKAMTGDCTFNRGWLHSGTHALDLFNMFNIKVFKIRESPNPDRVWCLDINFSDGDVFEEFRFDKTPVHERYDHHTKYVIDNAYNFLEGTEELFCTMYDGLKALEMMEELCKNS